MKVDAPANEALPTDSSKLVDGDVVMLDESNASGDSLVKHVSPEVSHASQTPANGTDAFNCPFDLDQRDDDENTPLHIAIHARKIEHVSLLLEAGASVHKKCDGSAPIHLAISIGAITAHVNFAKKCVELLSRHGADLTLRDDSFHTPLYLACVANLCSVVEMLLNDPGSKDTLNLRSDRVGGRPLHAAARCDVMRKGVPKGGERSTTELLLAAEGVDIDAQNNYGRTPLHIAASRGNWYVARLLINAGADVHLLDKRGFTPGQVAKKRGMVVPPDLMVLGEDSPMADVLKVHEYTYIEKTSQLCASIPDHPNAIQTLDADTTVSRWSFEAALRAAGSVCEAVDKVMSGDFRNAFCAVRPPGHHAGPRGIVTCPNDPDGSHGFCLLNNVAIGAAYARSMYRNDGIKKVAIIDFDVHHGNGTEDIVRQITPIVFFASTHGYGPRDREIPAGADDTYNHGLQRLELRDSYRKNVIPALLDFNPDMIFISAGFDAHRKDTMNFGYVGMIEEDYEWLTEQLVKVANTCCNGRVVSVLEGGDEGEWESQFERHMNEEKEKRRQMKMDRHARATDALRQSLLMGARHQPHVADHEEASHLDEESHNNDIGMVTGEEEPSRKRRRNQVDYKQLYEKMKQEEGGGI
ncbi:histone deacetylase 1 HDAC Hda1p [Thalassiosira pseudonana CCMP1335]|uniref:Histone deacetylase 1 HDAC Hda1p n=1 Tax=Thalassiosira pseudonana TaxID=35128 RepID=B8C1J3_THAPS|nr:histone deacetylase 1 HDAC Hda1p [Thalassiosira pseudonana CCMP1335]EED93251.1 histone deacetylase 1 HDAC Hda1p [Thalassiosira pseudonana CCMP1335]